MPWALAERSSDGIRSRDVCIGADVLLMGDNAQPCENRDRGSGVASTFGGWYGAWNRWSFHRGSSELLDALTRQREIMVEAERLARDAEREVALLAGRQDRLGTPQTAAAVGPS